MTERNDSAKIDVRTAEERDAEQIARLCGELGFPSDEKQLLVRLRPILRDAGHAVLVAQTPNGNVVGWVHVYDARHVEYEPRAEIGGLVVQEGLRGRGVGGLLIRRSEEWARRRGHGAVCVRSNVVRGEAHRFYEKLGYGTVKSQRVFLKPLEGSGSISTGK